MQKTTKPTLNPLTQIQRDHIHTQISICNRQIARLDVAQLMIDTCTTDQIEGISRIDSDLRRLIKEPSALSDLRIQVEALQQILEGAELCCPDCGSTSAKIYHLTDLATDGKVQVHCPSCITRNESIGYTLITRDQYLQECDDRLQAAIDGGA